jgi:MFS family permease
VKWDGKDDPENPFNWPDSKKWLCTIMFSLFTLLSPMSSTMVIPALDTISQDLNIPEGVQLTMVMSIFLLGYSLGPFILGPLSETYGRVKVLQGANLFYLVFNIGCAVAQSKNEILVFRFLSGIGGAAPQAVSNSPSLQHILIGLDVACNQSSSRAVALFFCWLKHYRSATAI